MKKKLIWIGAGSWFMDSLVWFREQQIDVIVIRVKEEMPWFATNYAVYEQFGFRIVKNEPQEILQICESLDGHTLVVGGGYFAGNIPTLSILKAAGLEEIDVLYRISKYNREYRCGAKCLRYHNGDTGFGTARMVDLYNEKIRYVDFLMFDNDLLRDFVLSNSQMAREKQTLIGYMETPLKRFVVHNTKMIERRMISIGRCFSQFNHVRAGALELPITFYPLPPKPTGIRGFLYNLRHRTPKPCVYLLAGRTSDLNRIYSDRKMFMKWEGTCAFGLSHMYDVFYNSVNRFRAHRDYYWSLEGQFSANGAGSQKEQYYAFSNNSSKDVSYLMFGIIPLVSHAESSYYKSLVDKEMAILIKTRKDLMDVLQISDEEIQKYRENIWNNRDMFTFEQVGELLLSLYKE